MAAQRILIIRRRYLGDIVLLGSVLRNLRLHFPQAHLTVLTEQAHAGVLPLNPDVHGALTFPRRLGDWWAFARALRRARFTHVLDFDNTDKTALVTRLTVAPVRATFDRELIKFRFSSFYTHTAKVTNAFYDSHHITDTYLALPAAIGVPTPSREVRLVPPEEDVADVRKLVGQLKPPGGKNPFRRVLIHPGSRSAHRIWPLERFAKVADLLQDKCDCRVYVTAGPREQKLVTGIRDAARSHLVEAPPPRTVAGLAALLAQFDVFLCHDSGPMHVASAVGTSVVALLGSQNATIWRPLGEQHTVLQTPLPCACLGAEAPTPCARDDSYRSYCVRKLTEQEVFAAVAAKLK